MERFFHNEKMQSKPDLIFKPQILRDPDMMLYLKQHKSLHFFMGQASLLL